MRKAKVVSIAVDLRGVRERIRDQNDIIRAYERELFKLQRDEARLVSRLFVAKHDIHRADVEMSTGKGKPWFGHVNEYIRWIEEHSPQKPFTEWNGNVYLTKDVIKYGWWASHKHGEMEHVPR